MKKLISFLLVVALIVCMNTSVFAATFTYSGEEIQTNAVLLLDADSGEVLYAKNEDKKIYPASTTKLMTALLVIEKASLDDEVTVGEEVTGFPSGSSLLKMTVGETLTVKDLLHAILLVSGNDAASALAVHIGGTQEKFVEMMNARAQELGMEHTHFVNPHGIKNDDHYTTAADMALLAREVLKHDELVAITSTESYTIPANDKHGEDRNLQNTNRLICTGTNSEGQPIEANKPLLYEYATGLKTGSTPQAKGCLVASATKDGMNLLALTFGDDTPKKNERFMLSQELFEFGFKNYKTYTLSTLLNGFPITTQVDNVATNDEKQGELTLTPALEGNADVSKTLPVDAESEEVNITMSEITPKSGEAITAPIKKGDVVGSATFSLNGTEFATCDLVASRDVYAVGQESDAAQAGDPISSIEPAKIPDSSNSGSQMVWLWLIIPVLLILIIIIRAVIVNKRRNARRRGVRRGGYHARPVKYKRRRKRY